MNPESKADTGREIHNLAAVVDEAARKWGDEVALYHYESGRAVTYKEVAYISNQVGNALRSLGVEIENRVAILMDDCPEWAFALLGSLKIGAVVAPLNTLLTENDYVFFLTDSRAKVLFVGAPYLDKIGTILSSPPPYLKRVVIRNGGTLGRKGDRLVNWDAFLQGAPAELEIEPTFSSDLALFAYTSGSTGRPRAIMHSHSNIGKSYSTFEQLYGMRKGDIQFHIPKLYFLTSLGGLISAFASGAPIVLLSGRPTPLTVLEAIARYRPSYLAGVPTIFARMAEAAKEAPHLADLSSVRYVFCTGEALSLEVFQRFKETFGKQLYNCWGAQELASAPLSWQPGEEVPLEKVGSSGKSPWSEAQVKIVDEHGQEVPNGVAGEIMFQVRSQFLGYWHDPKEAARKFIEGWYKPGDSFKRDQEGYYWYQGRLDDMVKISGRQVFPVEVEQVVAGHPAVLEDAVIPVKNEFGLTELQAFVVLRQGHSPSAELAVQIQNFVKSELAPYKRPHRVEFVSELPRTATGKIQRFRLRDQASGGKKH
jgi:benzoate-CoA ligase family protein